MGSRGEVPCGVWGRAPGRVWGSRPNVPHREAIQEAQSGREARPDGRVRANPHPGHKLNIERDALLSISQPVKKGRKQRPYLV